MSNTEFFDVLDLAKPKEDRKSLQREFCSLMQDWTPGTHHTTIVRWAQRRDTPIITVNFDENLSRSINAEYFGPPSEFTDYYPWRSYFADRRIENPRSNFAIWHAHGMMKYPRSIRLGLTHYMGAVQRARTLLHRKDGIRAVQHARNKQSWSGHDSWLDAFFFLPLVIVGFGFSKDETFLRWLILERARHHKLRPDIFQPTWYVTVHSSKDELRHTFFKALGIQVIIADSNDEIYKNPAWTG